MFTRYEVRSPQGEAALEHYADAVATMKGRDPDDPTSWAYQAAIHGTHSTPASLQNQCEHESWFFFPWHRIYLFYFEEIVRKAVVDNGGPADWALPYWNYCLGAENSSLPEPFRVPDNNGNPLYVGSRNPYYNTGGPLPDLLTAEEGSLRLRQFFGNAMFGGGSRESFEPRFSGHMGVPEGSPHGAVHVELAGLMGDPEQAAEDPIFWLHHCNIDRIWAVWNERENGENPSEGGWLNQRFEFFDAAGNPAGKTCGEVTATRLLEYTYDPDPGGNVEEMPPSQPTPSGEPPTEPRFVGVTDDPVPLVGDSTEVPVEIEPGAREEVLEAADPEDPRHLYLNVEEIRGEKTPGTVYAMYLNLPEDPGSEDYDRRHVGNLAFFGIERTTKPVGDEAPHPMRISVEVGDVIRRLRDETDWDREQLRVCFRPVVPKGAERAGGEMLAPYEEGHDPVRIGRVSLSIDA
jgi:tyrosinase